jgi:hypothetical protein
MSTSIKISTPNGDFELNVNAVASFFSELYSINNFDDLSNELSELRSVHREHFPDDCPAKQLKKHDHILQLVEYELPNMVISFTPAVPKKKLTT